MSSLERRIRDKIEAVGTPLKDWNISIYRGVLTGFNEAFIVDRTKKDRLVREDPKSIEILRPILRGRDIKRYSYQFSDLWLISTFPSLKLNIDNYPAVKQHLLSFGYDRLKQTGEPGARKRTKNEWFETQDSISYWDDFSKQKIVWIELTDKPNFYLDFDGYYLNNTVFFLIGKRLPYILSFLNSKMCEWYFGKIAGTSGVGTRRWIKQYIEQICIPMSPPLHIEKQLEDTVLDIQRRKQKGLNTLDLENQVDELIFSIVGLSSDEIRAISEFNYLTV